MYVLYSSIPAAAYCHCTEAFHPPRFPRNIGVAQIPTIVLPESARQIRSQGTFSGAYLSHYRDQETEPRLGLSPDCTATLSCVWARDRQGHDTENFDKALSSRSWRIRTFLANNTRAYERQPVERRFVPLRIPRSQTPLGPGRHGSIHAADHWFRSTGWNRRWTFAVPNVQPRDPWRWSTEIRKH